MLHEYSGRQYRWTSSGGSTSNDVPVEDGASQFLFSLIFQEGGDIQSVQPSVKQSWQMLISRRSDLCYQGPGTSCQL